MQQSVSQVRKLFAEAPDTLDVTLFGPEDHMAEDQARQVVREANQVLSTCSTDPAVYSAEQW